MRWNGWIRKFYKRILNLISLFCIIWIIYFSFKENLFNRRGKLGFGKKEKITNAKAFKNFI